MRKPVDRNGLEILERAEALQLVATATVGRLAYVSRGVPAVVPVNIGLADDDQVLFRLGTGRALAAIYARELIALEVDDIDLDAAGGWSVNIVGTPIEVCAALAVAAGANLRSWVQSEGSRLFRLGTDHLAGRRLVAKPLSESTVAAASAP